MHVSLIPMIARTVLIPPATRGDILGWYGTDQGAEEMSVTVGLVSPPQQPGLIFVPTQAPIDAVPALNIPQFVVEFGISGFNETIGVDAYPGGSFTVPASFIRISGINPATFDSISFYAAVCRSPGKGSNVAPFSQGQILVPAGTITAFVPKFARRLKITRGRIADGVQGAMQVIWNSGGQTIRNDIYPLASDAPLYEVPAGATFVSVINTDVVNQNTLLRWELVP